jgi:hypothetical protein
VTEAKRLPPSSERIVLDAEEKPREFLVICVATLVFALMPEKRGVGSRAQVAFTEAEDFVAEAERRYGKLNP